MFQTQFVQTQQMMDTWTRFVAEQVGRARQMAEPVDGLSGQAAERVRTGIDETARLMKASFDYALELGAAWRRIGFETFDAAVATAKKEA